MMSSDYAPNDAEDAFSAEPEEWYIVNVEAAIVNEAGEYLMIVRSAGERHAPGTLSLPGGKVEEEGDVDDVLEATLRREIREEVGIEVLDEMRYVESKLFIADDGEPVIDVVFLCRYAGGTPVISDPGEVAALRWMAAHAVTHHADTPHWIRQSIARAERLRLRGGGQ